MAQNPQSEFDDDWESENWPSDLNHHTSPIAGSQASIEWGVTNVRQLVTPSHNPQLGSQTVSGGTQETTRTRTSVSRGRGHLRRVDNSVPVTKNSLFNVTMSESQSQQHTGRPIVGRTSDHATKSTESSPPVFNFKAMASAISPSAPVAPSGDMNNRPSPASGFSFRQAASETERSSGNTAFVEVTTPATTAEAEVVSGGMNVDGQVSTLGRVLEQTGVPTGFAHMRKLEAFRQDPNHPLYSVTTFENLDLKVELKTGLSADHKCKLSAIQEKTLPALNSYPYRNCIAQSQNGTGKTVAFVVTMLNRVDFSKSHVQAVCLLPTKELAQQVVETTQKLGRFIPNIENHVFSAIRDSKHPHNIRITEALLNEHGKLRTAIVIGTAGTVNSLMRKTRQLDFDGVVLFVVDEADKMLERASENFYTTIENIVKRLKPDAQRVFFSATFNDEVINEAKRFMNNPLVIRLKDEDLSLDNIRHFYLRVRNREEKLQAMKLIYNSMTVGQSIVFCRTRQSSHWLCNELRSQLDFKVAELSGDMEPRDRDEQISRFRRSADRVLVTTNLSARGLDISSVNLIINWDPPIIHETKQADFDTYLHRVGRSGRFGADGVAVNMVEREADLMVFKQIERHFGITVEELNPSYKEMEKTLRKDYE